MKIYPVVATVELPDWPVAGGGDSVAGTWTPIIGGRDGESGQSYRYQTGHYVRVGPMVTVWSYTQFSVLGEIRGPLMLKNLPFPTLNVPGFFAGSCAYFTNLTPYAALTSLMIHAGGAQTAVWLYGIEQGKYMNPRPLNGGDLNDHTQLILSLSYPVHIEGFVYKPELDTEPYYPEEDR